MTQRIQATTNKRGVMTLSMNRPEVHNAFDAAMIREFTTVLHEADQDSDVRLLVITGLGSCFSAGADMHWMRSQAGASQGDNERDALELAGLMRTLKDLAKPTSALINGAACGGGLGLVAWGDITIAVDTASFGLTESRLGLAPAVISPYVFRRIGERYARRYFLTGERFDSTQAQAMGLIQQCVPQEQLDNSVDVVVNNLLKGGPEAVKICKELVFAVAGHNEETQESVDEFTSGLIAGLRIMDEGQEGLAAFLEKRKPEWVEDDPTQ